MKCISPVLYTMLMLAFILVLTVASQAYSMLLFSGDEAVVTGTITRIDRQSFNIETDEAEFRIDVTDMEMNTDLRSFFQSGEQVAIRGIFKEQAFGKPVIEARDILKIDAELGEMAASELLLYRRNLVTP